MTPALLLVTTVAELPQRTRRRHLPRASVIDGEDDVSADLSLRSVSTLPPDRIPEMSVVLIVVLLDT